MKINYIQANVAALLAYFFAYSIDKAFSASFLLPFAGLFYLFFATPFAFFQFLKIRSFSLIEKYFSFITFYFFVYAPIFFILHQTFELKISSEIILITNLIIFASAIVSTRLTIGDEIILKKENFFNKQNYLLLSALIGFAILHIINYHFYRFMPEWDGYTDLIKIEKSLDNGDIAQKYRGFFYTSVSILSTFSKIDPYTIFTFFFITLQSSLILVVSRFIKIFDIKRNYIGSLLYFLALSIPVINMEVDMTRPQNVLITFLPILIYFLFQFTSEKKIQYVVLSALIMLFGLNYHEFFVFPLLIYTSWLSIILIKKITHTGTTNNDRKIYSLLILIFFLIGIIVVQQTHSLQSIFPTAQKIISNISEISKWKLWFLDRYSSDGENLQMGWPGMNGALKYYAYYLSPALAMIMILFMFFCRKKHDSFSQNALVKITVPLLFSLFVFAEILPRLNHIYLPERFWIFIDILLIMIAIPIFKYLNDVLPFKLKMLNAFLLVSIAVGIAGSFYIAANKKALTSNNEYQAAMWIRENTSDNAFFITQAANGPMINFFAKRTMIPASPEYFLSDKLHEQNPENEIEKLYQYLDEHMKNANLYVKKYTSNKISFSTFSDKIQEEKIAVKKIEKELTTWQKLIDQPKYIVYSFDKFNTIYKDRQWWMLSNSHGANLEKFNEAYPLVYNQNGIYIWKVR